MQCVSNVELETVWEFTGLSLTILSLREQVKISEIARRFLNHRHLGQNFLFCATVRSILKRHMPTQM